MPNIGSALALMAAKLRPNTLPTEIPGLVSTIVRLANIFPPESLPMMVPSAFRAVQFDLAGRPIAD